MEFRDLHLNVQIRLVQNLFGNLLGDMVFPFMSIYFAETLGTVLAGLLVMLNLLFKVVSSTFGGYFADLYGRKRVKVVAESLRVSALAGMAVANSPWFDSGWLTCIAMSLVAICDGIAEPASEAMLIDVSTPETRMLVYSIDYWSSNLGLVIGTVVGGFLFQAHRFGLFTALAVFAMLTLLVLLFWVTETKSDQEFGKEALEHAVEIAKETQKETPKDTHKESATNSETKVVMKSKAESVALSASDAIKQSLSPSAPRKRGKARNRLLSSYTQVFQDRVFMIFSFAALFCGALEHMNNQYTRVRLDQTVPSQIVTWFGHFSITLDGVKLGSLVQGENALLVVLLSFVARRLLRSLNRRTAMLGGIFLTLCGFAIMAVSVTPWVQFVCMFVVSLGEIIWMPLKQTLLADLAAQEQRGAYLAVHGFARVGSRLLGGFSITLGSFFSPWAMFGVFCFSGLMSIVLYNQTFRKGEKYGGRIRQNKIRAS